MKHVTRPIAEGAHRHRHAAFSVRVCGWIVAAAVCAALLWAVLVEVHRLRHPSAEAVDSVLALRPSPGSDEWVRHHGAAWGNAPGWGDDESTQRSLVD